MNNLHNDTAARSARSGRSTLTAFFDRRDQAERAMDRLREMEIFETRLMPGYEADTEKTAVTSDDRSGFWAKLEDWLFPDDDRAVYAEGLRRGGFLVAATVDDATHDVAHDILDEEGSIDMDERADLWRSEGWQARQANEASAEAHYDEFRSGEVPHDEQQNMPQGDRSDRLTRNSETKSPRVRAYDLDGDLPQEVRDDIMRTEHQATVDDAKSPDQSLDGERTDQLFPRGR